MPSSSPVLVARLELPDPGSRRGVGCGWLFVTLTLALAAWNGWHFRSVPSVSLAASLFWAGLWLLIAAQAIAEDGGLVPWCRRRLGEFSRRRRLEIVRDSAGGLTLREGFILGGVRCTRWTVPAADLLAVDWSPGQASGITGRDCDDWGVAIWFRPRPLGRSLPSGRDLHLLEPEGPRAAAEALGLAVADLLRQAGVGLVDAGDGNRPGFAVVPGLASPPG